MRFWPRRVGQHAAGVGQPLHRAHGPGKGMALGFQALPLRGLARLGLGSRGLALAQGAVACTTNPAYGGNLLKRAPDEIMPDIAAIVAEGAMGDDAVARVQARLVARILPHFLRPAPAGRPWGKGALLLLLLLQLSGCCSFCLAAVLLPMLRVCVMLWLMMLLLVLLVLLL